MKAKSELRITNHKAVRKAVAEFVERAPTSEVCLLDYALALREQYRTDFSEAMCLAVTSHVEIDEHAVTVPEPMPQPPTPEPEPERQSKASA